MKISGKKEILFGMLALEKGFITAGQLGKAVSVQMRDDLKDGKHRFLGEILIEMGYMNNSQLSEILTSQNTKTE